MPNDHARLGALNSVANRVLSAPYAGESVMLG